VSLSWSKNADLKRESIKRCIIVIFNIPTVVVESIPTAKLMQKPTFGNMILGSFCPPSISTTSLRQIHLLLPKIPCRLLCNVTHVAFHVPLSYLHAQPIVTNWNSLSQKYFHTVNRNIGEKWKNT